MCNPDYALEILGFRVSFIFSKYAPIAKGTYLSLRRFSVFFPEGQTDVKQASGYKQSSKK